MISPSSLVYYVKRFLLVLNFRTSYINIALDIGLIDEVNDEIQALEKKLDVYKSQVLSDKERPPSTAQTLSPATLKGESAFCITISKACVPADLSKCTSIAYMYPKIFVTSFILLQIVTCNSPSLALTVHVSFLIILTGLHLLIKKQTTCALFLLS